MSEVRFGAPWGKTLKIISLISVVGCASLSGLLFALAWVRDSGPVSIGLAASWVPLFILAALAVFTVRGYEVSEGTLVILRAGWKTKIDLRELVSAEIDSKAMAGSLRALGIGGVFSYTGLFHNDKLGSYSAYVTDPDRCVVVKLPNRTLVVSPDSPERFVQSVQPGRMPNHRMMQ